MLAVALAGAGCAVDEPETPVADTAVAAGAAGATDVLPSVPDVDVPTLDTELALTLVAMPLSCLDRPHAEGRNRRTYLDTLVTTRVPGYTTDRAFYGCWDWHSAVNSTWAMVRVYKALPDIPVAGLIDEKLADHLSEDALAGELAFFEDERTFERPYGWPGSCCSTPRFRTGIIRMRTGGPRGSSPWSGCSPSGRSNGSRR